jgi:ArsR family transcriptional regulator
MHRLIVREIAMAKRFSMAKLEREAHLDRQTARRLWRNPFYNARPATLEKVATALGVHASELFREESEEEEDVVSSPLPDIPPTIFTPPLTEQEAAHQASVLKTLAEPTRLWIVTQLTKHERSINVKELASAYLVVQPTISNHLRALRSAGLISHTKKRQQSYYYVNREQIQNVSTFLLSTLLGSTADEGMTCSSPPNTPTLFIPLLTDHEFAHQASILKALGEPTRLQILSQLNRYERLMNVKELASAYRSANPTISTHLRTLQTVGLISSYKDEQWTYYYLNRDKIREAGEFLMTLIGPEISELEVSS